MSDLPPYPDSGEDAAGTTEGRPASTPRHWRRLLGMVLAVVVLLVIVVLHLTGTIGPGSH